MPRRARYIGTRLIAFSAIMIAALVGTLGVVAIMMHRDALMGQVRIHATQISQIVQRGLHYSMMRYDRTNIEKAISQIGQEEGIEIVRIFNKSGTIVYSAHVSDIGHVVSTSEEGCVQCHASAVPVVRLRPSERMRVFDNGPARSFGVVTPIYNEAGCAGDPCHQHPSSQSVLGVLYMTVSLEDIDAQLRKSTLLAFGFTILIIVALSAFLTFYVRRFIRRPVMELIRGVRRVATGDLDHQIVVGARNEIGELARAYNQMTVDLKRARQDVETWARSLEDRVRERTGELEQTQAQLMQSQKLVSMGKLAASVAHEINNPLMGILTFIRTFEGWIKDGVFPPQKFAEFRQNLELMGRETMRISKIVRNLLAFARRSKLERQDHQINDLLKQSVELLNHQLALQEIEVVLDLAPQLPMLNIDGGQIQQTFLNLMLNAAEAMGHGGTLMLKTSLTADGKHVSIQVRDTGPGIPKEILGKIFDPFFTTKEVGKGTGLGLPVAYGIVLKHGGDLKLQTAVGRGTTFEVLLPTAPSFPPDAELSDLETEES